jgi:hypothetical protein
LPTGGFNVSNLSAAALCILQMRGVAVSCGDIKRKCEIDCMLPTPETSVLYSWPSTETMPYEKISSCTDLCSSDFDSCSESDEATAALGCTYDCSKIYEAGMLACMQKLTGNAKGTVDDTMDDCANDATLTMNVCVETCHDEDVYGGWTEATEEGISADAMEEFLSRSTKVPNYRAGIPAYKASGKVTLQDVNLAARDGTATSAGTVEIVQKIGVSGVMGLSGLFAGSVLAIGLVAKRAMEPRSFAEHEPL